MTVGHAPGGFAVILAVPPASITVTLIDIVVRREPATEPVPSALLPAKSLE